MPSAHPIPSIPSLTLSFMLTVKRIDRIAVERTWNPWERAEIVEVPAHLTHTIARTFNAEGI